MMNLMKRLKNNEKQATNIYDIAISSGLKNAYGSYCAIGRVSGNNQNFLAFKNIMFAWHNDPYRNKEDKRIRGGRNGFN